MMYEEIEPLSLSEARKLIPSLEGEALIRPLLGICGIKDTAWVQETYLQYISHENELVSNAAILGLGHLARISGLANKQSVIKSLEELETKNPMLIGAIQDTLSDINIFCNEPRSK